MAKKLTHIQLLESLERVTFEEDKKDREGEFSQVNMAGSLLLLAELDHEHEYNLCRAIAQHLLGQIPEPDDADFDEI